ncbi:hypothetical protein AAC387_Pa03g4155 [Persea americana]
MGKDGERGGNAQMGHVVGLLVMDEGVGAGFLKVELVISGECWHGRGAAVFRSESGDEVGGHAEVGSAWKVCGLVLEMSGGWNTEMDRELCWSEQRWVRVGSGVFGWVETRDVAESTVEMVDRVMRPGLGVAASATPAASPAAALSEPWKGSAMRPLLSLIATGVILWFVSATVGVSRTASLVGGGAGVVERM